MIGPGDIIAKPEARAPARAPAEGASAERASAEGATPDADSGNMTGATGSSANTGSSAKKPPEKAEKGSFESAMSEGDAAASETTPPAGETSPAAQKPAAPLSNAAALAAALAAAPSEEAAPVLPGTHTAETADTATTADTAAAKDAARVLEGVQIKPALSLEGDVGTGALKEKAGAASAEGLLSSGQAGANALTGGALSTAQSATLPSGTAQSAAPAIAPTPAPAPLPPTQSPAPAAHALQAAAIKHVSAPDKQPPQAQNAPAASIADFIDPDTVDPDALLARKEHQAPVDKLAPAIPPLSSSPFERIAGAPVGGEQGAAAAITARGDIGSAAAQAIAAASAVDRAPPQAQAIVAQIGVAVSKSDSNRVEVRLDPPELGRLNMIMNVSDDRAIVLVSAERQDVVDLLRRHSDLLQQTLAEAGFGDVTLEFGQSDKDASGEEATGGEPSSSAVAGEKSNDTLRIAWPGTPTQAGRLDLRL